MSTCGCASSTSRGDVWMEWGSISLVRPYQRESSARKITGGRHPD